jgi:hypothetical protein
MREMTWTYDIYNPSVASGYKDGSMTITGPDGTLDKYEVDAAIANYGNSVALERVIIAGDFKFLSQNVFIDTNLTSIVFHENSQVIGFGVAVFQNSTTLTKLVLPPRLTSLPEYTFWKCVRLQSPLIIPETVLSIGDNVFQECPLVTMVLPHAVQTVGKEIFKGCTALTVVKFSQNLISIGVNTFEGATAIRTLRMRREIWSTIVATLPVPVAGTRQLVTFYNEDLTIYHRTTGTSIVPVSDQAAYDQVDVPGYTVETARLAEMVRLAEIARLAEMARLAEIARLEQIEMARLAEITRLEQVEVARLVEITRLEQAEVARLAEITRLEQVEVARLAEITRLEQVEIARLAEITRLEQVEIARLAEITRLEQVERARLAQVELKKETGQVEGGPPGKVPGEIHDQDTGLNADTKGGGIPIWLIIVIGAVVGLILLGLIIYAISKRN